MEKQSIVKALERARDEIANALNLINHGVINPGPQAAELPGEETFGDTFGDAPAAPAAAEPAKRGRKPKAQQAAAPAPDSDPFADAMNEAGQAGAQAGGDDDGFFSESPMDTGPTEKMVNDALVGAVARLVAAGNGAVKKTDARDKVLGAMEKKFGSKNPAALKPKWAEIIAYFTPKAAK